MATPQPPPPSSTPNARNHHRVISATADMSGQHLITLTLQISAQFYCDSRSVLRATQQLDQIRAQIANQILSITKSPELVAKNSDQVIVALATLQSSVQDLSRAYINHANTVLAPGRGGELNSNLTNILTESGLLNAQAPGVPALEDAIAGVEGKKKRKRVPHDPNAPKRALTPYFLYMQSARQQIAKELGENAKPKEVADEGTRRWGEMPPAEKAVWDALYQKNLAVYRVRMAAYKAGQPVPDEDQAAHLVDAGKAPEAVIADEAEGEASEESTPEPVKEPEPPKSKRRKSEKAPSPAKETPKAKGSEKKSKKAKKEASPAPEPASTSKGTDKKKRSKKA